jgi:amidase
MPRRGSAFVPHDLAAPVRGRAAGPLAGLTFAVKDMYDIAGERTGGGSPQWLAAQPLARRHADAVRRLLDAGATAIGKTVCDEFFYSVTGANHHYGTPVNPRAPGRLPGGSSAGSAVATAGGACDFALGSDTGGSVRVPAALNGVYGIRATHGRLDGTGAMRMAPTFDAIGWFSAGPGLLRRIGGVMFPGAMPQAPLERVLLAVDACAHADDAVTAVVQRFLARVRGLLPEPEPFELAGAAIADWRAAFRVLQAHEVWRTFGAFIRAHRPPLGPGIRERMAYAASVSDTQADEARAFVTALRADLRRRIPPGSVVCLPTAPCIAPRVDAPADELDRFRTRVMTLVCPGGLGGLPQVTLPAGTVDGCPVGVSFMGWAHGDETLLDLAARLGAWCGE